MKSVSEMSAQELLLEAQRREERRAAGKPLAPDPVELERRAKEIDARLEKEIQSDVVKLYKAFRCTVYNLSQPRATKQSLGLPDLWVFYERDTIEQSFGFWHETKTPTGQQSEEQHDFQIRCVCIGTPYVLGGVLAAEEHLIKFGIAERINGTLEPVRR